LENLLYGTPDENRLDAIRHGTFSTTTASQAVEIRRRASAGESMTALAGEFGLHYQTIYRIKNGLRWGIFLDRNREQLLGPG
jgi:hypothetical protein